MAARPNVAALLGAVAPLIAGPPQTDDLVGRAFLDATRSLARIDHVVVFAYRGHAKPVDLYSTFNPAAYRTFVSLYQAGPYLLDPFFHAALAGKTGLWRMGDLAPDRFFSSDYFRTYYSQTELAEEIGFFVPVAHGTTVVLSLMRGTDRRIFTRTEMALLRAAVPFVHSLTRTFWGNAASRFGRATDSASLSQAPEAGREWKPSWDLRNLTRREALIVDLVLRGHSSEAIGQQLGTSTGTVKVHRRNIYRKLNISSQTQLLSLYLRAHRISSLG
ncbi:MAG: helix-turn-helix transcriptional regulator [Hyphomicrobiales bacterium]|nr:helix-turn-helix transcriptional regulator [Hyphomicrobiales bacterium]